MEEGGRLTSRMSGGLERTGSQDSKGDCNSSGEGEIEGMSKINVAPLRNSPV